MNSSIMKVIAGIYAVLGVIGSIVTANKIEDIFFNANGLSTLVAIIGIISTLFVTAILLAVAKTLEYAEQNNALVNQMYQAQRREHEKRNAPADASNSKMSLSSLTSANTSDGWRCPKCGKSNPTSSRTCKDCGYQK